MTASLAKKAIKNTCLNVDNTEGIIIHSDLGSQYTSQEFEDFVTEKKCCVKERGSISNTLL